MKNPLQHRNWISRIGRAAASAALALAALLALRTQSAQAQTFTTLASFDGTDGSNPLSALVQATNGKLYGTTNQSESGSGYGSVFEITTTGTLTSLYTFCPQGPPCADGYGPVGGLVQATNGDFYGTTEFGGTADGAINPFGTVFKITPSGTLTTLDTFLVEDGSAPEPTSGLVQASNGDLYGTTQGGGANGEGTVYKITPAGKLTTIYSFCSQPGCPDGQSPYPGLILATNGVLYGTTDLGGTGGAGTVFKITTAGKLTTLHSFCSDVSQGICLDGLHPASGLVQASNGSFYGTTLSGGTQGNVCVDACGTVFKITSAGKFTSLYSFCSQSACADGNSPYGTLIQATDGNLYGTTEAGGNTTGISSVGYGTIFEITTSGAFTTLYTFCEVSGCPDGGNPYAGLIQDTNGIFYGTTPNYGTEGGGTVYSLSVGLGPFVKTNSTSGKVGAAVAILGTDLTGATSVTFNGTAAAFTVVSSSEITTNVPTGATTGLVEVVTPGGTLTSNVNFKVP